MVSPYGREVLQRSPSGHPLLDLLQFPNGSFDDCSDSVGTGADTDKNKMSEQNGSILAHKRVCLPLPIQETSQ